MTDYHFSSTWFDELAKPVWEQFIPQIKPGKILEVGSHEGASICYLIDKLSVDILLDVVCVDFWGMERDINPHDAQDIKGSVERSFDNNINLAISRARNPVSFVKYKGYSDTSLAQLLTEGKRNYFDFVYIDGSHAAPDVLCDAVLGFRLLKVGGWMVFDDYLWVEHLPVDPINCPKAAIDAFTTLYCRKLSILSAPLYQIFLKKLAD